MNTGWAGTWRRLRRRKLVQWGLAYLAGAWAVLEVLDLVGQQFGWLPSLLRGITLAFALGFVVTLVLAWYHGERGAQKVSGSELLVLGLLFTIGGGLVWNYAKDPPPPAAPAAAHVSPPNAPSVAAAIPDKSIAVLPLSNESDDKDQQYFSDGLSEDLITALSQFAGLKVISRNSAFQFRDSKDNARTIGEKLGVAHLLEGSIRRQDDTVRISAQLVRTADGSTLWSQRYDRPYRDLFALQDEITKTVADALKAKLIDDAGAVVQSDRPPGGNVEAYTAFLRGKFHFYHLREDELERAIVEFEKAIALDPRYVPPRALLSGAWTLISQTRMGAAKDQAQANARRAVDAALAIDPDVAMAHIADGALRANQFDWSGAEAAYRRALRLSPNDSTATSFLGQLQLAQGHSAQAVALARKALANDPLSSEAADALTRSLAASGQLGAAARAARMASELHPGIQLFTLELAIIDLQRGDPAAALRLAQDPGVSSIDRNYLRALAAQFANDRAAADRALEALIDAGAESTPYQIAQVYGLRREPDEVFAWLDRARNGHDVTLSSLLVDPFLKPYRDDPRFAALCAKIGLPAPDARSTATAATTQMR